MRGFEIHKSYFCSKCGKELKGAIMVANETRKNKRGRIAWGRDCICEECYKKLKKEKEE